jgi:hypothetical protein
MPARSRIHRLEHEHNEIASSPRTGGPRESVDRVEDAAHDGNFVGVFWTEYDGKLVERCGS